MEGSIVKDVIASVATFLASDLEPDEAPVPLRAGAIRVAVQKVKGSVAPREIALATNDAEVSIDAGAIEYVKQETVSATSLNLGFEGDDHVQLRVCSARECWPDSAAKELATQRIRASDVCAPLVCSAWRIQMTCRSRSSAT